LAFGSAHREAGTVVGWHRRGFRLFWTWKSRRRTGPPGVPADGSGLIRELSMANPLWGAPRIHGELQKLGLVVSQSTVAKYMRRHPRPPSQTWRTFLTNHASRSWLPTSSSCRRSRTAAAGPLRSLSRALQRGVPASGAGDEGAGRSVRPVHAALSRAGNSTTPFTTGRRPSCIAAAFVSRSGR
jgi:hypothetical protein